MKKSILSILVFTSLCCCAFYAMVISGCSRKQADFAKLRRLEGSWLMHAGEKGDIVEQWIWVNDSLLKGKGMRVSGADTSITEYLEIQWSGKDIFYVPAVADQNDGKPVFFKLTAFSDDGYQFENPNHDFPSRIDYQLKGNDSLTVTISGNIKNEFREIDFKFRKINAN